MSTPPTPIRVIATWSNRCLVRADDTHVYLVDPALPRPCTCAEGVDCGHVAAVLALDERQRAALDRISSSRRTVTCPNCGQAVLIGLTGHYLTATSCPNCGFGRVAYDHIPSHGNGRPGRRAVTATRYVPRLATL